MSSEDERYDLLIGFLEGELDDDERELIEEELAGPGDAQDRLEAYRGLGAALAELEPPAPSAEARDRAYAAMMAAMAEDSAATPVEAPAETSATPSQEAPAPKRVAPVTGGSAPTAPRGQILRFMSALAAAALVMVSAVFYLDGLETPQSKIALAPKKVALEKSPPVSQAREAEADMAPEQAARRAPGPEAGGFVESLVEAELTEPEAPKPERLDQDQAKAELEARVREELERERAALAKNLEGGGTSPDEAMRAAGVQAPTKAPMTSGGEAPTRAPATPPAEPAQPVRPRPEAKGFGQPRDADRANDKAQPADAPEGTARRGPTEAGRRSRKKAPGGQQGAKSKEARPAPQARRKVADEPPADSAQTDGDGTQRRETRQGGARPEADSSAGGGGGGGARGRSMPQGGGGADDLQVKKGKKGKTLAGKAAPGLADGKPNHPPTAGRRDQEDREEELSRFRRLRPAAEDAPLPPAKELQPAWIVTRGRKRVLYVMEGSAMTQAPFSDLPLADLERRAKAKKSADPGVKPLQVTALVVQRRALATKRTSVDLRVLERREDLLAIAKLELASEAKTRAQSNELGGRPGGPGSGAPAGKKGGQSGPGETGKTGQQEPEQPNDSPEEEAQGAETEEAPAPGAQADGKRMLPAPAAGRDRAELLLRLLGVIETRRPSRTELRRALRDAERRQVEARRRR